MRVISGLVVRSADADDIFLGLASPFCPRGNYPRDKALASQSREATVLIWNANLRAEESMLINVNVTF